MNVEDYYLINGWMPEGFRNFNVRLLHLGSRNGFSVSAFKTNVAGKSNNLVIITADNGMRFGFYTPLSLTFSKGSWVQDDTLTTFIFSLDKKTKFTLKNDHKQYALYDHSDRVAGVGGGHDIYISDNSNSNTDSYSNLLDSFSSNQCSFQYQSTEAQNYLAGSRNFKTKEIAWYQIYV